MPDTSIRVFNNHEFGQLRVVRDEGGEPWFVAKDVCDALGLTNVTVAISRLDDDERAKLNLGPQGESNVVNEAGLYTLVLSSRKPEAHDFKRWVTHEVLPSIRRDGGYMATREDETPEETMARAVLLAQKTIERQKAQIDEMRPKAYFADAVGNSDTLILVRELAHVLCQHGFQVGQNRLFNLLRRDGYLEQHRNEPTQRSIELGIMRVTEGVYTGADGQTFITRTAKITPKGQRYFVARYNGAVAESGEEPPFVLDHYGNYVRVGDKVSRFWIDNVERYTVSEVHAGVNMLAIQGIDGLHDARGYVRMDGERHE